MALTVKDAEEYQIAVGENVAAAYTEAMEEEEEEELFEINLEAVNEIPPPHYWESYFTETSNTLLANCLLPIVDVSCAVPTMASACDVFSCRPTSLLVVESVAAPKFVVGLPSFGVFATQYKETNA